MIKKIISCGIVVAMLLGSLGIVYADAQSELDKLNEEKNQLNQALNEGKKVENGLNKQIKNLESNIANTNLEIKQLDGNIEDTEHNINAALAELDRLEADIAAQQVALGDRLRAMYMNGNIGVLDVLLGSSSMTDLMTNMDRVQRVYDSDKAMLDTLETQHKVIATQRAQLENLQASLENKKAEQAQKKEALESDKADVAEKKADVASDNRALEEQIDATNAEANALVAEILKLQGNQEFIGGEFAWPVPGVSKITSPFGYRIHPILHTKKLHTGIDIGAKSGSTVVAANAGTVIKAGWNNSYGYMVMVDHGGGIVTLYAHNSSLVVGTGDVVAKGQAVAKSGSTGMSTGPHVHFEVRVNGEYVNPMGYL